MNLRGRRLAGRPAGVVVAHAGRADREVTQAVLKQAFEDERLTQDEFEARVGKAMAARTQGELAELTRDIPRPAPAPRRGGRIWLLAGGAAVLAVAGIIAGVLSAGSSYADDNAATSAVGAALNTHASLAAGLLDAVHRIATVAKASH
ncbi:MAG TPA: DUF1707 domain-containing protein [Streptosporangiaceae bacterium]|nr:DUF1707 domain-containing protein [Streptosporangiaceae bacterium]